MNDVTLLTYISLAIALVVGVLAADTRIRFMREFAFGFSGYLSYFLSLLVC
ncbi:hypothetical protein [Zooshikella ganghwensis]|uniref:hypothetical protein n=1 Tax=Zooshikella ganghwensis TaxID=202772 RepID=UPI0013FD4927|nr:hypothetical protein [Zooshikella ganghwensis]